MTLTLQTLKDATVVPSQTVQMGGKGTYLFAVKPDNTVEQRLVTQGVRYQDLVKPGETVVVEGQLALANGVKVKPKEYPAATPVPSSGRGALTERETLNGAGSSDKQKSSAAQPAAAL